MIFDPPNILLASKLFHERYKGVSVFSYHFSVAYIGLDSIVSYSLTFCWVFICFY